MKKPSTKNTVKYPAQQLPIDTETDWKRVDAMSEQQLQKNIETDKDAITVTEEFWQAAKLVMPATGHKERITIRIDSDILDWLKEDGRGYQSRINAILRTCMNALKQNQNKSK
jgi:uncharacterized protein (DUF4415 family)